MMQKTILFLAANPKETSQLNLKKEVEAVQQELARLQRHEQFIFKPQWATTREALRHALLDHQPHIVHFSGHDPDPTQAGIALENEKGESQLVSGDTLAHFFEPFAARIECVILNACFNALQASHIVKYVDFVIAMNQPIKDKAAIRFAIGFYDALAAEKSIPTAFKSGSTNIQGTMPRAEEHLKPVLKQRFVNTHWLMPIQKNRLFTGRQAILHQLQNSLHFRQVAALSGVGGIGKTQTAARYARLHRHEYRAVLWCLADTVESLNLDLVAIARTLDLPEKDAPKQKTIIAAVKNWLATHSHWLLILDNVDDLKIVNELTALAKSEARNMLLTTRAIVPEPFAQSVEIHEMSRDEGVRFLLRHALDRPRDKKGKIWDSYKLPDKRDAGKDEGVRFLLRRALDKPRDKKGKVWDSYKLTDERDAGKLVDMMGALPLALVQAGAYIQETQCGLTGYLDRYQTFKHTLLQERGTYCSQDHPESVAITCLLSFEKITAENPTAIEVLRLGAFLHPDSIPEEVFQEWDVLALDKALKVLLKYSFVKRHPKTKMLMVPRLVQTILRHEMDEATQRVWAEKAVRAVNSVFQPKMKKGLICERLLLCAQTCAALIEEWQLASEEAGRLLNQIGEYSYYKSNYESAKPLFERALAIRDKVFAQEHPDVATSLNNLAGLYRNQGDYEQAKPLYERALAIKEKVFGKEHPDVANSLNNLAALYYSQGDYGRAKPLYEHSLAIKEKVLGKEHPDVATSLNNLAELYRTQGFSEQAKPLYERSLAIKEKVFGKEHPDVANSLNNLAGLYYSQGDYERVKPLFERALAIHEKVFGGEHPLVATSLNNLALLYKTQGDYEQAKPLYERALKILNKFFQPDHPHVDTFLKNYVYTSLLGEMKKPTTASKG